MAASSSPSSFDVRYTKDKTKSPNNYGIVWGDFDGDGHVDTYLAQGTKPNTLLRNRGDGTFEYAGVSAGVDDANWSNAAIFCDLDNDGDVELWVANDRKANALYRNNGDGTFTAVANTGTEDASANTARMVCADVSGDGYLDIIVANNWKQNRLFLNPGDGTLTAFEDVSSASGVEEPERAGRWEGDTDGGGETNTDVVAADFDGDGDQDLFIARTRQFLLNAGDGTFIDQTEAAGLGNSPSDGSGGFVFG